MNFLIKNPNEIYNHYLFLHFYLNLSDREKKLFNNRIKEYFGEIDQYYKKLIEDNDEKKRQIGIVGFSKFKLEYATEREITDFLDTAIAIYANFSYLNEIIGDCYWKMASGNPIVWYEKELKVNPGNNIAKIKLFEIVYYSENAKYIAELLNDPEIANEKYLYSHIRMFYLKYSISKWITSIFKQSLIYEDPVVIINAVFILCVWIIFFIYLNVFKDIHFLALWITFFISILSVPLVVGVYDYLFTIFLTDYEPSLWKDNLIVGLVEEFSKMIVPLFVTFFFLQRLKSPVGVLVLFSISALIFATIENMLYFENYYDISIVSARGIFSIVIHICCSTLIGYGFVQFEFRNKSALNVLYFFLIAALLHGFYDLVLSTPFYLAAIPIVIIAVFILISLYNNALNNSVNFDAERESRLNNAGLILMTGLSLILLSEFLSNSFSHNSIIGKNVLWDSMLSYGWLIFVFASPVSNFKLVKGKWSFINLGGMKIIDSYSQEINRIVIIPFHNNNYVKHKNPIQLNIVKAIRAESEQKWFLCFADETNQYFLITFKEDGDKFIDSRIPIHVLKAHSEVSNAFKTKEFPYLGLFYSSPVITDNKKDI